MNPSGTGRLLLLVTLAAFVALHLPWNWHQNASLSPNLRDLAEWITLSPQAQAQNPSLAGSLLLRGAAAMLAVLISMLAVRPGGGRLSPATTLLCLLVAVILGLSLLPPLDALSDPGNLNYRQQFLASGFALVGIMVVVAIGNRLPARLWDGLGLLFALGTALLAIIGLVLAQVVFSTVGVSMTIGGGAVSFIGLQSIQAGIYGRHLLNRTRPV